MGVLGDDEIGGGELVGEGEHFLDSRQTEASRVASCGEDVDDEEAKLSLEAICMGWCATASLGPSTNG